MILSVCIDTVSLSIFPRRCFLRARRADDQAGQTEDFRMKKRIFTFILAVMLCASLIPAAVFATGSDDPTPRPTPVKYTMIEGADQTVVYGHRARFVSDADFSKYFCVEIDRMVMPEDMMKIESGSTVVTLKKELVRQLSPGRHMIRIFSRDGSAVANFTVKAAPPKTGDGYPVALWTVCLTLALGGSVILARKRRSE